MALYFGSNKSLLAFGKSQIKILLGTTIQVLQGLLLTSDGLKLKDSSGMIILAKEE